MKDKSSKYCGCLYYSANALARVMTRLAEESFSTTGLAPSYAFLLMMVNDQPGIQAGELSQKLLLAPSTVTRLIEKMEVKGYLERKTSGKFTSVYPTARSLESDPKIREAWRNLYKKYIDLLGEENSKHLTTEIFSASQKLDL
jgi:DNA-binding MarR family transcriptional regulator